MALAFKGFLICCPWFQVPAIPLVICPLGKFTGPFRPQFPKWGDLSDAGFLGSGSDPHPNPQPEGSCPANDLQPHLCAQTEDTRLASCAEFRKTQGGNPLESYTPSQPHVTPGKVRLQVRVGKIGAAMIGSLGAAERRLGGKSGSQGVPGCGCWCPPGGALHQVELQAGFRQPVCRSRSWQRLTWLGKASSGGAAAGS